MKKVYIVQLPKNYYQQIVAFVNKEDAENFCKELQKIHPICSIQSDTFVPQTLFVYERKDLPNESE